MAQFSLRIGWQFRTYLCLRFVLQPVMYLIVALRVAKGKDDPARSPEKLGKPSQPRPPGKLVWLHAVGLGEVLALRPLIAEMAEQEPDTSFLITSTARSAQQVLAANLPPRTCHQLLPLDGPTYVRRFLHHWRPDVAIWTEQDLWPGVIYDAAARAIPLAYINARMTDKSTSRRGKLTGLYRDLLGMFGYISGQDENTLRNLRTLGASDPAMTVSLKAAAAPLPVDLETLSTMQACLAGRKVWVAASTHEEDEVVALAAHQRVVQQDPTSILIIVPRFPQRGAEVAKAIERSGFTFAQRSLDALPKDAHAVYLGDSLGELGLWYRVAQSALVGGGFGPVGGHNPWEAVALHCRVMSGPTVHNFTNDYETLRAAGVAMIIPADDQAASRVAGQIARGGERIEQDVTTGLVGQAQKSLPPLAKRLLALE